LPKPNSKIQQKKLKPNQPINKNENKLVVLGVLKS